MKNTRKILVTSVATVVAAGTIGINMTNANFEDKNSRREVIHETFENHSLEAFYEITKNSKRSQQINTEEKFDAIILAYNLRKEKKFKEARNVLENAGIERLTKMGKRGPRADMRDAIKNADWDEFKEVTKGKNIAKNIDTQEKFIKFVEAVELRRDGRHNEAHELMKQLGLRGRHM